MKPNITEDGVAKAINTTGLSPAAVVDALKDGVMIKYGDLSLMVTPQALNDCRTEWLYVKQHDPAFADGLFAAIEPTLAKRCKRALMSAKNQRKPPRQEFMDELVADLKLWHVVTQN